MYSIRYTLSMRRPVITGGRRYGQRLTSTQKRGVPLSLVKAVPHAAGRLVPTMPYRFRFALVAGTCLCLVLTACARGPVGVTSDQRAGIKHSAEAGDVEAQYRLARIYDDGDGVKRDVGKAISWYRRAAESGQLEAQMELGEKYRTGTGVERNLDEAEKWYSLAVAQGHPQAKGLLEKTRRVKEQKEGQAAWARKEAAHLAAEDHRQLAVVKQDAQERIVESLIKTAQSGDADAQHQLAWLYQRGNGVPQDTNQAIKWFSGAAHQGHAIAARVLGDMVWSNRLVQPS